MTLFAVSRRAPAINPLALALSLALVLPTCVVHAEEQTLPAITINGARFDSDPALAPIGATVITADDIRRAGAADVNQAIRKIGGVFARQSLDASSDFGLDLRGFGANSGQNLVVMLDGVRLSENDLGGAILSVIPIETVERIEITRGGSSVLFGDGATGGVIQITSKRPGAAAPLRGTLRAEGGEFGLADLRASLAKSWDGITLDAALGKLRTDNYRDHNGFDQKTFSGALQWRHAGGRAGLRVDSARQDAEFAGALSQLQFETNPRLASTPEDGAALESDRATLFAEQRFGNLDLAAEVSRREKTTEARYVSEFGVFALRYDIEQTQFSPRLRHLARSAGLLSELVVGYDRLHWERATDTSGFLSNDEQRSHAVYARNELKWQERNARVAFGARRESVEKDSMFDASKQSFNAWDLQASIDAAEGVNLFAKVGRSFRVPTADENGFRDAAEVLRFQSSRDLELGAQFGTPALGATVRAFRHRLTDEIFFDPTAGGGFGANTNLDPTERKGLELDAHADLPHALRLSAHLHHVKARFVGGPNAGRDMVLVPKNVVTARLAWVPGNGHSADIGAQWVGRQRFGSDFDNSCAARINSYATVDARYARQLGAWEFALAGLNLGDRQYYSNAFGCRQGIYPSDGRQLKLSARYDF